MTGILTAIGLALALSAAGTPWFIRFMLTRGIGQPIREDGPSTHFAKRGVPTMGGIVLLVASTLAYFGAHIRVGGGGLTFRSLRPGGLTVLATAWALGIVGFLDDFSKVRKRRSLGLNKRAKSAGQVIVGIGLAMAVSHWTGTPRGLSWAGFELWFLKSMPQIVFAVWIIAVVWIVSNAVNFTDGQDGLATGSTMMALFVFTIIAFWESRHPRLYLWPLGLSSSEMLDVAMCSSAVLGACFGFLWYNAPPARIIMGDTGSMALGGTLVALALLTRTQLLLPVIGALFVIEFLSVVIQVASFHLFNKRRPFKMAPIHNHFELSGWPEVTTVVRFWLFAALAAGVGLAIFYQHFLNIGGAD